MLRIIFLFGLMIIVAAGIVGFFIYSLKKTGEIGDAALEKQAKKRNGRIVKPPLFSIELTKPKLELYHNDTRIEVFPGMGKLSLAGEYEWSMPREAYHHLYIKFRSKLNRQFKMEILPNSFLVNVTKSIINDSIKIDNPEFEKIYSIRSNNAKLAVELLSPDIQSILVACSEYSEYDFKLVKPIIKISKGQFQLILPTLPKKDEGYDRLIDIALLFCGQINKQEC